jgi:hypothetical protein
MESFEEFWQTIEINFKAVRGDSSFPKRFVAR